MSTKELNQSGHTILLPAEGASKYGAIVWDRHGKVRMTADKDLKFDPFLPVTREVDIMFGILCLGVREESILLALTF